MLKGSCSPIQRRHCCLASYFAHSDNLLCQPNASCQFSAGSFVKHVLGNLKKVFGPEGQPTLTTGQLS